jgi:hypothetical protein
VIYSTLRGATNMDDEKNDIVDKVVFDDGRYFWIYRPFAMTLEQKENLEFHMEFYGAVSCFCFDA